MWEDRFNPPQKRGLRRERSALDRKSILVKNYEFLITRICTHIEIYGIHFWTLGWTVIHSRLCLSNDWISFKRHRRILIHRNKLVVGQTGRHRSGLTTRHSRLCNHFKFYLIRWYSGLMACIWKYYFSSDLHWFFDIFSITTWHYQFFYSQPIVEITSSTRSEIGFLRFYLKDNFYSSIS